MLAAGCVTIKSRHEVKKEEIRPQLEASEEHLLASYNEQARAVQSLQATVDLIPSTGTTYSGVIEEYHDVPGFILAERPATVRVIGQAPVVAKNIFDMVSDGKQFRIYIPSKNAFLVGPTALTRPSKKPIENLRPQHIVEALFWPELPASANVLFEQFDADPSRYYILTLLRHGGWRKTRNRAGKSGSTAPICASPACNFSEPGGQLDSDIAYSDWQPVASGARHRDAHPSRRRCNYARDIHIWRPQDDYKLEIHILEAHAERTDFRRPV